MTSELSQEACEATLLTTSAAVAYSSLAGIRQLYDFDQPAGFTMLHHLKEKLLRDRVSWGHGILHGMSSVSHILYGFQMFLDVCGGGVTSDTSHA